MEHEVVRRFDPPTKLKRPLGVTRVVSFTSGKGGVGKSNTVINVAIALAKLGRSVLVLDADLGLANINVLVGIKPELTLHDLFSNGKQLSEIVVNGPEGISIIPAASGVESICSLDAAQRLLLMSAIEEVAHHYDYLLIDTQAGIGREVMYFNSAASEIVCLINEEPTALTDAYALIKVLSKSYGEKQISVIANNVPNEDRAKTAFDRLARAVERFLHVKLRYIGFVPSDQAVSAAVREQRALLEVFPSSAAARAISGITGRLDLDFFEYRVKGGMQFFFKQLLEVSARGY